MLLYSSPSAPLQTAYADATMPHQPSLAPFCKLSAVDAARDEFSESMSSDFCLEGKAMSGEEHHRIVDDFEPIRVLGRGAMGTVLLAVHRRSKKAFAIKAISKKAMRKRPALGGFETEKEVLVMVRGHPSLANLHSHFESSNYAFLVMDYCCGGDLNVLRHRQAEKRFSEAAVRFYAAELVLALERLHHLGIVYRDLKPENVLISEGGHVVLTDFDLSLRLSTQEYICTRTADRPQQPAKLMKARRIALVSCFATGSVAPEDDFAEAAGATQGNCNGSYMPVGCIHTQNAITDHVLPAASAPGDEPQKTARHFVGTEEYVAPEVIRGEGYSFAVDWWALGVLLYELLYGRTPFKGPDRKSTFSSILHREAVLSGPWSPIRGLIRSLLVKEPRHRLACAAGVKAHAFFQGVQWEKLQHIARPPVVPDGCPPLAREGLSQYSHLESFLEAAETPRKHMSTSSTSRSSDDGQSDESGDEVAVDMDSVEFWSHDEITSLSLLPTR